MKQGISLAAGSRPGRLATWVVLAFMGLLLPWSGRVAGQETAPGRLFYPTPEIVPVAQDTTARQAPKEEEKKEENKEDDKKKEEGKLFVVGESRGYSPTWTNTGLQLQTPDKAFMIHVGGRIHMDAAWWNAEDAVQFGEEGVGPLNDGSNFRRARIRVNGRMYQVIEWLMEYGFETGDPAFFDVYGEIPSLPYIGNFRAGHFREPFSMDAYTSGNHLAFIERSLLQDAFVPFRNTGVMIYDTALDERMTWAVGLFQTDSNAVGFGAGDGKHSVTGRLTFNPWYDCDGLGALHLGVAGSTRTLPERTPAGVPAPGIGLPRTRFATRPEMRVAAPNFADTGFILADHQNLIGAEFGLSLGQLLFQGEYMAAFVENAVVPGTGGRQADLFYHGFYAQASWFITGEHRPYNRKTGVFGQLVPHENFFWRESQEDCGRNLCGRGAWEVGVRYSFLDLNDNGIDGGILRDLTFGLNWYLTPNARVMWNYILAWRDAPGNTSDGLTQILGTRFQIDF